MYALSQSEDFFLPMRLCEYILTVKGGALKGSLKVFTRVKGAQMMERPSAIRFPQSHTVNSASKGFSALSAFPAQDARDTPDYGLKGMSATTARVRRPLQKAFT